MPDHDNPFNRPDVTSLRPRPGAGRRDAARPRPQASAAPTDAEPIQEAARGLLGIGLNPLVRTASPLLLLAGQLRGSLSPMDVQGLRRHALDQIHRFEAQAREAGVQNDTVIAARYALCAALDEAVLSTPWGAQSEWAQHTLLVALHREAWGGEKFFEMLDRISQDPERYIDLMELQYLCLALGFAGKYQVLERGHEHLAAVQQDLYRKIRNYRGAPEQELSLRWRGLEDRRNPVIRYVPWWVVAAASLAILAITFTAYRASLTSSAAPVHAELAKVGVEAFSRPVPAPVKGPRLKELLAPDEASGALRAEEDGGRTVVTLLGPDLFASGSATVNPTYYQTLERIAAAVNQVPGRVLVVGHTDDQPVRSLRYQDNYELSHERARGVSRILQLGIDNDARVTWQGVGSSQPLYRPESDPANRARNRRVEIIHLSEQ